MDIQTAIRHVASGGSLERQETESVFRTIMQGDATPAQIGGLLVALSMKGETVDEIAGAASVMREFAVPVPCDDTHLVDTCGTGGDGAQTFNISTAAAFVVAAAGGRVAKHGNRSISSRCGSADVLEAAGVNIEMPPEAIARCINEVGVGFMFAPAHHGATRYAAGPRRELGMRTMFNVLGPMTNPASTPNQVVGVFDAAWVPRCAEVLRELGSRHVMVVHAEDGLDEFSIAAPTFVAELADGAISTYTVTPAELGVAPGRIDDLVVDSAESSLAMLQAVLDNSPGPALEIVCLNAGAAIYVAGLAPDHATGITHARELIASGAARQRLDALVKLSREISAA
ncbi:MAG: anthranilate phosphoribosyltransferase [Gammaproteobacteria bacterium]|nr:anthranilate phosphoribosyltransferase [Gammaproteobacteria bacterium]NNL99540.1 anthranilate phosphoribosyltransferase [Gammaproteobacteria bacterium]